MKAGRVIVFFLLVCLFGILETKKNDQVNNYEKKNL